MEKRGYSIWQYPNCKDSDLHAKAITDNRFYCISNALDNKFRSEQAAVSDLLGGAFVAACCGLMKAIKILGEKWQHIY